MLTDEQREARSVVNGQAIAAERLQPLVQTLKTQPGGFYWVRRLLSSQFESRTARRIEDGDGDRWAWQQLALAYYKDDGLPRIEAFDRAERVLRRELDLDTSLNPESLGIAGGLYKQWWSYTQQVPRLRRARDHYLRGHTAPDNDGYCGVNGAFVIDLLAEIDGGNDPDATANADALRGEVIELVNALLQGGEPHANKYFLWATLGEAHFARGEFAEAEQAFSRARDTGPEDWEIETTARQLGAIVRVRRPGWQGATPEYRRALETLVGDADALESAVMGRVGLALSGGGFRASLFHLGVLARLAEADELRHIEVIACVSGGSIVGAHYYLELQRLLETKLDRDITRRDYIDVVEHTIDSFIAGVQTDIRNQIYSSPSANFALMRAGHNGTRRLGELFERELFARVDDGRGTRPRWLHDLLIHPAGEPAFDPLRRNAWRRNKVPVISFNTTCLNTGHLWQFTATWMGEPATAIDVTVDGNERLRRLYHDQAPSTVDPVRLGEAVAASAAVPGLFPPFELHRIYQDRTVSLVDGGAQDNQGVATLLAADCQRVIVSDASGQLPALPRPAEDRLRVTLRSSSAVQHALRSAYHRDVSAREANGMLRKTMWIHLKHDLESQAVNWIGMPEPTGKSEGGNTSYGIDRTVQRAIADLRTDLDAFTDIEADALMLSGYRMVDRDLARWLSDRPPTTPPESWRFSSLGQVLGDDPAKLDARQRVLRHLRVGRAVFGKLRHELWWARAGTAALAVALALVLALFVRADRSATLQVLGLIGAAGVAVFLGLASGIGPLVRLARVVIAVVMATIGWIPAQLQLMIGRPARLRSGRRSSDASASE